MPLVRHALRLASAAVLAAATLAGSAGTASATEELPSNDYCFTVDGTGVCLTLGLSVTHSPDVNNGDATAAMTATVGTYCTGDLGCTELIDFSPVVVGRSGVVAGNPTIEDRLVYVAHFPEVCAGVGCFGPYDVPVYAPMPTGSVATVWVLGRSTDEPCWLTACP